MEKTYPLAPLTYLKHVLTWTKNIFRNAKVGEKKNGSKGQTGGKSIATLHSCTDYINNYGHY